MRGGQKRLDCPGRVIRRDSWQHDLPFRGLKPRRGRSGQIGDLDHVNSLWQGCVQPAGDHSGVNFRGEGDLEELSLTRGTGGRPARVRNFGMRREAGRVCYG